MMSNPPQGINGKSRGGHKGRPAPKALHSPHKTPIHRPPPPPKCSESKASWKACIKNGLIPQGTRFKTHHSRHNAEIQVEERGYDSQGIEQEPPTRAPRRHSQAKSLYISRAVRYL